MNSRKPLILLAALGIAVAALVYYNIPKGAVAGGGTAAENPDGSEKTRAGSPGTTKYLAGGTSTDCWQAMAN